MQNTRSKKQKGQRTRQSSVRPQNAPRMRGDVYAAQQQSRAQNSKRHKLKRRGNNALLYIMVLILMLTVGVVLIFTVFFKVINIEVVGLSRYSKQDVIKTSGIVEGVNMFRLDRKGIEDALVKKYSYFEAVHLKYGLPDTITIKVMEAEPAGAIQQGETYILISASGRVLETDVTELMSGLPIIKGFNALQLSQGSTIEDMLRKMRKEAAAKGEPKEGDTAEMRQAKQDAQRAAEQAVSNLSSQMDVMKAFLQTVGITGFTQVNYVDLSDKFNLVVGYNGKIIVEFGSEAELAYKIQCVQKVIDEKLADTFEGKIDASYPGRVRVRRLSLQAQDMTEDEYAEYLYEQNGGEQPEASDESSAESSLSTDESNSGSTSQNSKPDVSSSDEASDASSEEDDANSESESEYNSQGLPEIG